MSTNPSRVALARAYLRTHDRSPAFAHVIARARLNKKSCGNEQGLGLKPSSLAYESTTHTTELDIHLCNVKK
jgi:hypothetical protein